MTKQFRILFSVIILSAFSCGKVPITGRRQINLLPESQLESMSLTSYHDFLSQNKVEPANDPNTQLVRNVGERIKNAVVLYTQQNNLYDRVKDYKWEFNLVNDKTVNAWCMPGGKVVVYSGLLPVTKDEASLALVLGHEIGHAVARHGNERMSEGLLVQMGGMALDVAMSQKSAETRALFDQAYGVTSNVGVMLPYSRVHETEADELGLVFMAMAGYDPRTAPAFWQRMKAVGGAQPPELLSTHPSDDTRIKNINDFMPQALKYYKPGK